MSKRMLRSWIGRSKPLLRQRTRGRGDAFATAGGDARAVHELLDAMVGDSEWALPPSRAAEARVWLLPGGPAGELDDAPLPTPMLDRELRAYRAFCQYRSKLGRQRDSAERAELLDARRRRLRARIQAGRV